jgi:hypothetical protein
MDAFLKLLKFGLDNKAAILSIWVLIFGAISASGYNYWKPVELDIVQVQPPTEITPPAAPPKPQVVIREVIREVPQEIDYSVCERMMDKHVTIYHFGEKR